MSCMHTHTHTFNSRANRIKSDTMLLGKKTKKGGKKTKKEGKKSNFFTENKIMILSGMNTPQN